MVNQYNQILEKAINYRRDFHMYPETGWLEFRTTSIIAKILSQLGYEILLGKEIINENYIMGKPNEIVIKENIIRAINEGADEEILKKMDNLTGVVGILDTKKEGPTVAFRFDIDALELEEPEDPNHKPYKYGYFSRHKGVMHACGHDAHAAIGLVFAEYLAKLKDELKGKVILIFQPAEEGVRGAKAMVEKGIVDDADYFFTIHIGFGSTNNIGLVAKSKGFFATTKLDVTFKGKSSHAAAYPHLGKNALLAASNALINLYAIPPNSEGQTRINVGVLHAGNSRNIIPDKAFMQMEIRGETDNLVAYMKNCTERIIDGSSRMYDVKYEIIEVGSAISAEGSEELVPLLLEAGKELDIPDIFIEYNFNGSDDATYFIKRVQEKGGKAIYSQILCPIAAPHHNNYFDFDEKALLYGVLINLYIVKKLLTK
ncbi:MAG: amidohydrolase [Thermovenabulum sp.]|uniref:amidohydrolase n=1 Tax=Thermovenabulum sp. TaxID=3100335 RepID=UPI003C7CDA06